jgi:hypothetical protein
MKITEARCRKTPISVINELRYAGCHLLRALRPSLGILDESLEQQDHSISASGETPFEREVRRGTDHCKRAMYDAIEYDTMRCGEVYDLFCEKYRPLFDHNIDGLADALDAAGAAKELVEQNANLRQPREELIGELDTACGKFRDAMRRLNRQIPVFNAIADKKQREIQKDRITRIRWWVSLIVGIVFSGALFGSVKMYVDSKASSSIRPDASINTNRSP